LSAPLTVNRFNKVTGLPLWQRALIVAVPTLIARWVSTPLYWTLKGNDAVGKLVHGAPVYERAIDVPELDKKILLFG